jgi:hypothetical protein
MNADKTMKTTAKSPNHDWSRFDAMSEAQRTRDVQRRARPIARIATKKLETKFRRYEFGNLGCWDKVPRNIGSIPS